MRFRRRGRAGRGRGRFSRRRGRHRGRKGRKLSLRSPIGIRR